MFILLGTKDKTKIMSEVENEELCMNCQQNAKHLVLRERKFFTLFFIPILPLRTRYLVACPACNYARKIKKAQAKNYCNHVESIPYSGQSEESKYVG